MDASDKAAAERVIQRLCVGAQIDGIRFGPIPQLLITDQASEKEPVNGQVYINLASTWRIFTKRPKLLSRGEEALPAVEGLDAYLLLCQLHEAEIASATLADDAPDLMLTFTDGRFFLLNGRHPQFEAWQLGVSLSRGDLPWLVVAVPGDGVAVWDPEAPSIG